MFTEHLLELLGRAFGGVATAGELSQTDDHWHRLVWQLTPCDDDRSDRRFRQPPAIEFQNGTDNLRWCERNIVGMKHGTFTVSDLAAANPNESSSRHPRIREIGGKILLNLRDRDVADACHPAALMEALRNVWDLWPGTAAAICSEATGESYWNCYKYSQLLWRYHLEAGGLALAPPYTRAQLLRAEKVVSAPNVAELLNGPKMKSGKMYMPILKNEEAGIHTVNLGKP